MVPYGAVIIAGGTARRLGGVDKPMLPVCGVSMLQRVLAAVDDAAMTVVVGPRRDGLPTDVRVVREQPPGGGPVAALAAALRTGDWPERIAMLAGDMPLFTRTALGRLEDAIGNHEGAVFADADGGAQWLCGLWRTATLRQRVESVPETANRSLRALLEDLDLIRVQDDTDPPPWFDCDTDDDLRRAEEWLAR